MTPVTDLEMINEEDVLDELVEWLDDDLKSMCLISYTSNFSEGELSD